MKKRFLIGIVTLAMLMGMVFINTSYAITVVLQDGLAGYTGTQDTYIVESGAKDHNDYGDDATLWIRTQKDNNQNILIYFDLSSLPLYSSILSINSATLSLYKSEGDPNNYAVGVYRVTKGTWDEGDGDKKTEGHADWHDLYHHDTTPVTWNTPGLGATDYALPAPDVVVISGQKKYFNWDVEPIVLSWWSAASSNYGFYLTGIGAEGEKKFNSSESRTKRPKLTIDYTPKDEPPPEIPEPASLLLFGLSGIGMGFLKRRR